MKKNKDIIKICDNCKREPESFLNPDREDSWWVVCDEDGEVAHLLSNLKESFLVCGQKTPVRWKNRKYLCIKCVESMGYAGMTF